MLLLGCAGCDRGIVGSGISKTQTRELGVFTSLAHDSIGDVTLKIGQPQSVTVTTDDNLQDLIQMTVVDGELQIGSRENFSASIGPKIEITVAAMNHIQLQGVGSLELSQFDADDLSVNLSGVGSIKGTGKVKEFRLSVSGVGSADFEHLNAQAVHVAVSGVGSAVVHASESVDANTSGVGGIRVLGNPKQHFVKNTGVGKVTIQE